MSIKKLKNKNYLNKCEKKINKYFKNNIIFLRFKFINFMLLHSIMSNIAKTTITFFNAQLNNYNYYSVKY